MTKSELILKIGQETYYLRKMFESCKTYEQVQSANRLACFLIGDRWTWYENEFGLHAQISIHGVIRDAASDLELFYRQAKERVAKKEEKKNTKIQTGYWD